MAIESVKIKISKIGLRSDLSWPKLGLEPKFHEPGTFGGFGKREQTYKHTRFMFYKYRLYYEQLENIVYSLIVLTELWRHQMTNNV